MRKHLPYKVRKLLHFRTKKISTVIITSRSRFRYFFPPKKYQKYIESLFDRIFSNRPKISLRFESSPRSRNKTHENELRVYLANQEISVWDTRKLNVSEFEIRGVFMDVPIARGAALLYLRNSCLVQFEFVYFYRS